MVEPLNGRIRRLFRLPRSRRSIQAEIDDEIRFHLETRVAALQDRGIPVERAREIAEREYGDVAASRAELAAMEKRRHTKDRLREILQSVAQDVRYAARGLAQRPALAFAMIATLTLGITASAIVFSIVDELLLRPPAQVANVESLRQIYVLERDADEDDEAGGPTYSEVTSYAVIGAMRDHVSSFVDVVATYRRSFILGRGTAAQPVDVSLVDGNFFSALGVTPAMGRLITPNDSRVPSGEPVAVVSSRFGVATSETPQIRSASA